VLLSLPARPAPLAARDSSACGTRRESTGRAVHAIAVDSDHAIWRAFQNAYWPALHLADAKGVLRYHHFGEGRYDESERMIRQLLAEGGNTAVGDALVMVEGRGAEAPADWGSLGSEESYVGYDRAQNFASPGDAVYAEQRAGAEAFAFTFG
jgi:hypothetical protein